MNDLRPSARLRLLPSALLVLLAPLTLLGGCGGDEAQPPRDAGHGAEAPADPVAEATEPTEVDEGAASEGADGSSAEGGEPTAEASPFGHGRKRFGLEATVTPAPEDAPADAPARIHGTARLLGNVPERKPIAMDFIAGCRKHGPGLTETVMATEDGRLQNVVVNILRGVDKAAIPPLPEEPAVLTQEGCVFKPHVVAVRAGQTLEIKNLDTAHHNVNTKPSHGSNPAFNKMQPGGGASIDVVFPRPEVAVPVGCDIHPFMKAWIAVVDHPFYSISDAEGAWSIELPPGDYLVEAWHERYGTLKGEVEVGPGESAEFKFHFEAAKKRR